MNAYQLHNVQYNYSGTGKDQFSLNIHELTIPQGSITVLAGPNGSGKTTLLYLLSFLEFPNQGTITFFGEIVKRRDLRSYRTRVGLLLQNPYLFTESVLSNVCRPLKIRHVAKRDREKAAFESLEMVGLHFLAEKKVSQLSGGQAQRIALARTLVMRPKVLLLDEPANHIDAEAKALLSALIPELREKFGTTIVMTSHDNTGRLVQPDTTIHVNEGRIIPCAPVNLFHGMTDSHGNFVTGKLNIVLGSSTSRATRISIDPTQIVLNGEQNIANQRFQGVVKAMRLLNGMADCEIEIGELLHAYQPIDQVGHFGLGDNVDVTIPSRAITILN